MLTNLIATVVVSVVTNWVLVHEQIPWSPFVLTPCNTTTLESGAVYTMPELPAKGKYIGDDGTVIEVTEIQFTFDGKPCVHRIERPLEKIIRRCKEQPVEQVWEEKREKL